jgi:hypothetical protein
VNRVPSRQNAMSLGTLVFVGFFIAVDAQRAFASAAVRLAHIPPTSRQVDSAIQPTGIGSNDASLPSVSNCESAPVSEGLLPERRSQISVELKQSKDTSIGSTVDQGVRQRRPAWLGQSGLRPVFVEPSVQILFCTWLA